MSVYPPLSPHRRQGSTTSIASLSSSDYSFPSSRSTTVTSNSTNSSRFSTLESRAGSPNHKHSSSFSGSSPMLSAYTTNTAINVTPRQLPQSPSDTPSPLPLSSRHTRHQSVPNTGSPTQTSPAYTHTPPSPRPLPPPSPYHGAHRNSVISGTSALEKDDIDRLKRSSVSHFRTLSNLTREGAAEDFGIGHGENVTGMHGRRRLQRAKTDNMSSWERMTWMDKRRQYIQAYEYLCHIGEAKEWIEDCMGEPIPPIVEMEEALRNGVTLAKLARVFAPELVPRIFEDKKLQFRHSDNIARFFKFLRKVEMPDVFIFELTDLYNKKNIPKVIYCIHALSFLLFRLGLTSHVIGNLVGKLEFTEAEIQTTQRGLDIAGVSLPSFRGVNKHFDEEPEPEPEPVESEEERIVRELGEAEPDVIDLVALCRGALLRQRLGDTMEDLWESEETVLDLQSRIRGMFTRISVSYQADRSKWATDVQAATKGYLVRQRYLQRQHNLDRAEPVMSALQSRIRGNQARHQYQQKQNEVKRAWKQASGLQAAARGALLRQKLGTQLDDVYDNEPEIIKTQAAIRGLLSRRRFEDIIAQLYEEEDAVTVLQGAIRGNLLRNKAIKKVEDLEHAGDVFTSLGATGRGVLLRRALKHDLDALAAEEAGIQALQSFARGALVRKNIVQNMEDLEAEAEDGTLPTLQANARGFLLRQKFNADKKGLEANVEQFTQLQALSRGVLLRWQHRENIATFAEAEFDIVDLQACARGMLVRRQVDDTLDELEDNTDSVIAVQARCRAAMQRWAYQDTLIALQQEVDGVVKLQGHARGFLHRLEQDRFLDELDSKVESVVALQAAIRGALVRQEMDDTIAAVEAEEELILELQAAARGALERKRFNGKLRHFRDNMQKVIKIQSFVRGKQQGEAYKSLMGGKNPPVGTVKNFVHLLNDSDFDFDEEIEFERLRKNVVQHVRANELAETYVDQLDVKIALLVKNKITLDEVIKHQKRFSGHVGNLLSNTDIGSSDPFDLKALNNNSRKRLERYQQMFYALQTQPQYLARLFNRVRDQNTADKELKRIETLVMGIFGYAQKRREEYYLLRLMVNSIREEVTRCERPEDFLRGNFFWVKLVGNYIRSPKDRKFLRELLGPLIRDEITSNNELDLESDPMQIYRASINNEELRTGQRSQRNPDVGREQAIKDRETRETFIGHLQALRTLSDDFISLLEDNVHRVPYGVRYIAQQSMIALSERFPHEGPEMLLQIVSHFLYQKYFRPALVGPESFGIVEKSPNPLQKKNLGELGKILNQVTSGRLFAHENVFLQPLNEYVAVAITRMKDVFRSLVEVPSAEERFEIDAFEDLTSKQKPTLYIKMSDIFAIHRLVAQEIDAVAPGREDPLRELVGELGSVQASETELRNVGQTEIGLQLDPSFQRIDDPDSEVKALMVECKRCVLYIIRVQTGTSLMEILVKPIAPEDEERWEQLLEEEKESHTGKKKGAYADESFLCDFNDMTYAELKRTALENIIRIERMGKISRKNNYQDLLNAIAMDIRTKHRRRVQRSREMEGVKQTLSHLGEKASYLESQLKSYNDYIEQAMVTLQTKKGKKKTILPFTRQYFHMRELQRAGRVPKFGSYKYSARALAEKGVLKSLEGYPEKRWDKVNFTISSDEVGVFFVEASNGSMIIPGASAQVLLDDLLQMQFHNNQFMLLCDGMIKFNVNLFLHLLFRKFYRDE